MNTFKRKALFAAVIAALSLSAGAVTLSGAGNTEVFADLKAGAPVAVDFVASKSCGKVKTSGTAGTSRAEVYVTLNGVTARGPATSRVGAFAPVTPGAKSTAIVVASEDTRVAITFDQKDVTKDAFDRAGNLIKKGGACQ